jgi:molybdopterin molybdotransferase
LPGNPVSAFVTFCLFARPFLVRLAGRSDVVPTRRMIAAGFEREVSTTRREFLRARAELDSGGVEVLRLFGHQGSHVLSSLAWATGLADLPLGARIRPGDPVAFLPFAELLR